MVQIQPPQPISESPFTKVSGLFCAVNHQVYVLRNAEQRFYIGLSDDVPRRVTQHNVGISQWTRGRGPWALVWTSARMTLGEARRLENLLKRQKGGRGFFQMTGLPPTEPPGSSSGS